MSFDLLIASISRHISLTAEEVEFFTSLLKSKFLANGEFLLREGEICKCESFVIKGCLKTYYLDENGFEHIIDFSIEEWWADDLYSKAAARPDVAALKPFYEELIAEFFPPVLDW